MNSRSILAAIACLCRVALSGAQELSADNGPLNLTVDLGYSIYQGVENTGTGQSTWKGIRFAAPPVGKLRWQVPQDPDTDRTAVLPATDFGAVCPKQYPAPSPPPFEMESEDCLYLNVYAPSRLASGRAGVPVFVYIHGGGYGLGDGRTPMEEIMAANGNGFVAVTIQYRLGAFGFAASPEIKSRGVLNAGLLDQEFALKWVQKHISKFGGDPRRVTIAGLSAGAGSVMLLAVARDGKLGESLFSNLMPASPYLPTQPRYDDKAPIERYERFAEFAGCSGAESVFDCLVATDSQTLQSANSNLTAGDLVPIGNWANIPVTDGEFLTQTPSLLLSNKKVNGKRLLAGSNANEGPLFTPKTINTEDKLKGWLRQNFFNLSEQNITAILDAYPSVPGPDDPNSPRFETNGRGPATAVNVSQSATGHQQRANNIYAEATFVCPAYWLADAFNAWGGRKSYYYQFSVPWAGHGWDSPAAYGPDSPNHGPDLKTAFRRIYGNFILNNNPSIANSIANGESAPNPNAPNPASAWPQWATSQRQLLNINQTGGVPYMQEIDGASITLFAQPGQQNAFELVDAYTWEGGRGRRCDFWQTLNPLIPQ